MVKKFKNLFNLLDKLNLTYAKAEEGANVPVDSELSATSINPVQNKIVTGALASLTETVATKANKSDIAPEFAEDTNYNKGDLVYHNGNLYEFQVNHSYTDEWNDAEVIQKDLSDVISGLGGGAEVVYTSSVSSELMEWSDLITLIGTNVTFDSNHKYEIKIGTDTFTQGGSTNSFYKVDVTNSGVSTLGLNFRWEKAFIGSSEITNNAMGYDADTPILVYELPY